MARGRTTAVIAVIAPVMMWLAACADPVAGPAGPPSASLPSPTATATHGAWSDGGGMEQPPPFQVRYGADVLELYAYTFCYRNGCVDGIDDDPPSVGSPNEIFVRVPVEAFDDLVVSQSADGDLCDGRRVEAEAEHLGDGWWRVSPRGPAGEYRVSLFARGDGAGDMVADVWWETPSDEPLPEAEASLALIADHDGEPDSYGLELMVTNLPTTPKEHSATITVTAANGASRTIDATPAAGACVGEGALYFDGPDGEAKQAADLGDFPFTTRVELMLDGVVHVATATYPDDEIEGYEPHVALRFTPPLP